MTGPERGFLLLSSHLGDPERKVLTTAQLRTLAQRAEKMEKPMPEQELSEQDLLALGYNRDMAARILTLLSQEELLDTYCAQAKRRGCVPVTWVSEEYPRVLRTRLGKDSPGCLWAKGDLSLLNTPSVALVGSRELRPENRAFAEAVGVFAAQRKLTLVSGNARGADQTAQQACLVAGGRVVSIVADALADHREQPNVLFLSEDGFAEGFTAMRALSRNRCIHALGQMTFVAQAELKKGGSWQGTANNLRHGWSPVLCFRDDSEAGKAFEQLGAYRITMEDLADFELPEQEQLTMF